MPSILIAYTSDGDKSHENWYRLEFDEETGEWAIEHEWDYLYIARDHTSGTKRYTLPEAKVELPRVYEKAIELLKVRLFNKPVTWENQRSLGNIKYD